MRRYIFLLVVIILVSCTTSTPKSELQASSVNWQTTKLATIPERFDQRLASIPIFSPLGDRVVYFAREEKSYSFFDGDKETTYLEIKSLWPTLSSNGKHVAYVVSEKPSPDKCPPACIQPWYLVIDGKKYFAGTQSPFYYFSPDGEKMIVTITDLTPQFEGEKMVPSRGKSGVYLLKIGGEPELIPELNPLSSTNTDYYIMMSEPVFSQDGNQIAYLARKPSSQEDLYFVVDGQITETYNATFQYPPKMVVSDDFKHVAFTIINPLDYYVITDGKPGKIYGSMNQLTMSPDGTRIAYSTIDKISRRPLVVLDGEELKGQFPIVFSPDSKQFAYVTYTEDIQQPSSYVAIYNGKKYQLPAYNVGNYGFQSPILQFSSDGTKLAYVSVSKNQKIALYVNEHLIGEYDYIDPKISFSPDSKKIAFGARKDRELWWIVEDVPN